MALTDDEKQTLEVEYKDLVKKVRAEVAEKVKAANELMREIEGISEAYGVPIYSSVTPLGMGYMPASFKDSKFSELDLHDIAEVDYYPEDVDLSGWERSMVC